MKRNGRQRGKKNKKTPPSAVVFLFYPEKVSKSIIVCQRAITVISKALGGKKFVHILVFAISQNEQENIEYRQKIQYRASLGGRQKDYDPC